MKKYFLSFFVLLVLSFISFPCYAQSNDVQPFAGTWISQGDNIRWIFNSDGTGSMGDINLVYAATSGKLVLIANNGSHRSYEYYFTDNGSTLIIWAPGGGWGAILKRSN